MHLYHIPVRKRLVQAGKIIGVLAIIIALLQGAVLFSLSAGRSTIEQQRQATEDAIRRAAVSCYSIEGVYPQKMGYLVEHYGLSVDTEKFSIEYQAIGDNILPTVIVGIRGEDAF